MTNEQHTLKRNRSRLLTLCLGLLGLVFMASCNKNDDTYVEQEVSGIKFIHALPGTTSLGFGVSGQLVTSNALLFAQSSGYFTGSPGTYLIQAVKGGTTDELLRDTVEMKKDMGYSFFVTKASLISDVPMSLVLEDNLSAPASGKAKVRFVNLSRAEGALDLGVGNSTTAIVSNKAFRSYSDFVEIDPASYIFQAKSTGTSDVKAVSAATSIAAGGIYTVWTNGVTGGTGDNAPVVYIFSH